MRPLRFLAGAGEIVDHATLVEQARRAESVGYNAFVMPDHLVPQLAALPALAVVADATQRLRIGTFVLNNDLRHPAVLAHDLATLDLLSEGRLEIGIGAGWNAPEYEASGLRFEPVGTRVERLGESIEVLKGLFSDAPFSFEGRHYRIHDLDGQPKPVQRPHPPLFVGGGGRRLLTLAGREADIIGLAPRILSGQRPDVPSSLAPATAEKIQWIREAAGERFDGIELNTYASLSRSIIVTDDVRAEVRKLQDRVRQLSGLEVPEDELLDSPHVFIGSIDSLADHVRSLRERFGITSFLAEPGPDVDRLVERLAGS